MTRERTEQAAVGLEKCELYFQQGRQPTFESLRAQRLREQRLQLLLSPFIEGHDERLLGWEIVIGRAEGHPGLRGDLPHGGLLEAMFAEQRQRCIQDPRSGFLRFAFSQGPVCRHGSGVLVAVGPSPLPKVGQHSVRPSTSGGVAMTCSVGSRALYRARPPSVVMGKTS